MKTGVLIILTVRLRIASELSSLTVNNVLLILTVRLRNASELSSLTAKSHAKPRIWS